MPIDFIKVSVKGVNMNYILNNRNFEFERKINPSDGTTSTKYCEATNNNIKINRVHPKT